MKTSKIAIDKLGSGSVLTPLFLQVITLKLDAENPKSNLKLSSVNINKMFLILFCRTFKNVYVIILSKEMYF